MDSIYAESVALFRSLGNDDETARALVWWGQSLAYVGEYRGAAERLMEARAHARRELAASLLGDAVGCYLMIRDVEAAVRLTREELSANAGQPHPVETPLAIAHVAALGVDRDPRCAALLSGHARARLEEAKWTLHASDEEIARRLSCRLETCLSQSERERLLMAGSAMTQSEALAEAARLLDAITR
jgi:hypothetical protein